MTALAFFSSLARTPGAAAQALPALALSAILLGAASFTSPGPDAGVAPTLTAGQQREVSRLVGLDRGKQAEVLSQGTSAQERNSLIPLSTLPVERVSGFTSISAGNPAFGTALKCLTQAIYYEAANEPLAGKRGVAQVVLNRMRHPAYPHSVCGVVYQGWNQRVCQFSFTCDGSLLRTPMASKWRESETVARAALQGATEPEVGSATHYHADYVLPRWAFTLAKVDKIGAHIFYRFPNGWGRSTALSARWVGSETLPRIDRAWLIARSAPNEESSAFDATPDINGVIAVAPHVTDRHAPADVGGRMDPNKQWRLSIPDPVAASSAYRSSLDQQAGAASPAEAP